MVNRVFESTPIAAMEAAQSCYAASDKIAWEETKPGVHSKLLYQDEQRSERTLLVRLEAGARSSAHSHTEFEQIFVLEGSFEDGERRMVAGDFCCRSPGQVHTAHSIEGALVLVTYTADRPG